MFQAIAKLIEGVIAFRERQSQSKRVYFDESVRPLFGDLDAVHRNYLGTIESYRSMLNTK